MGITLREVAREAGVSVTTASRALSGYDDVADQTRRLVERAADRLGYVPNLMARRLKTGRTGTMGFIIPDTSSRLGDPFFSNFIAGIGNEASAHGYDLLITTHSPDSRGEHESYTRAVGGGWVDGVILVRTRFEDWRIRYLYENNYPFVTFGRSNHDFDYPFVDEDSKGGVSQMVQHLVNSGHQEIAFVSPPANLMFARLRRTGYIETMESNKISWHPEWIREGDMTRKSGYEQMNILLASKARPTAVIAGNDMMALGVMDAIQERSLVVGKDISVCGFDDVPVAAYTNPSLTTLRQPIYDIGRRCCRMLVDILAGNAIESKQVLLSPQLIVRESTGLKI
ncbi:MAG: LacI family DNA-binding transcriptional regulator [Chloroflexota bacterium]